jgi:hypothetical protein
MMKDKDVSEDTSLVVDGSRDSQSSKRHDSSQNHRVKLVINGDENGNSGNGLTVHQLDPMSEEEVSSYYMQRQDFTRCDADTKETILEWAKYQMGHRKEFGQFHTTRGLEDLLDQMKYRMTGPTKKSESSRHVKKVQHVQEVLHEVSRQKSARGVMLDTEQLRRVSLELSKEARERAKQVAVADAKEAREILFSE